VVERVLLACPGVREAAVFSLPDARRGERVAAAVVPYGNLLSESDVKEFCRARLVDYQCPSAVFLVDELPRNTMGKVLRRELQERFTS
jgi:acyl-CoA synthetase (AMP-forming)/AMP-acid ligase II